MHADLREIMDRQGREGRGSVDNFLEVLSNVSKRLININLRRDCVIDKSLEEIGLGIGASRAYICLFRDDLKYIDGVYEWCGKGVSSEKKRLRGISTELLPWWMSKLSWNDHIVIDDLNHMPLKAEVEKEILAEHGVKSILVMPIYYRKTLLGYIGVDNIFQNKVWDEGSKLLMGLLADKFGAAIEKLKIEREKLKRSDRTNLYLVGEGTNSRIGFNTEDINEIIGSVLDMISLDIEVFNDVRISLSEELPNVRCNKIELGYLISKAVERAIERAREKICCLEDGQDRVYNYLGIKTYGEGDSVVCRIVDNGASVKSKVILQDQNTIVCSHCGKVFFNRNSLDENEVTIKLPGFTRK